MDSRELSEWMAYERIEPFGEMRADLRAGIVASVVANANRTRGDAFKPADFMPNFDREEEVEVEVDNKVNELMSIIKAKKQG
jgi:hypothetical protein